MADETLLAKVRQLQAVCLFAADIVPTTDPNYVFGWRSGRESDVDKTGPVWSYERVKAAAALWLMNHSLKIVPSGGKTTIEGGERAPAIASVISFELEVLGVSPAAIIEEPEACNTAEQVLRCAEIVRREQWDPSRVAILAPCWQLPRVAAMLLHMADAEPFSLGITPLISMERALALHHPDYNKHFVEWYASPEAREMFAKEALGTGQLLAGHQPKYPNPFRGFNDPLA